MFFSKSVAIYQSEMLTCYQSFDKYYLNLLSGHTYNTFLVPTIKKNIIELPKCGPEGNCPHSVNTSPGAALESLYRSLFCAKFLFLLFSISFSIRDTNKGSASALPLGDCDNKVDCPLPEFIESTQPLIYERFKKEYKTFVEHKYTNDKRLYFIR